LYLEAGIFIPNGKRRCFPKKERKKTAGSHSYRVSKVKTLKFFFPGARPLLATPSYATG